MSDVLEILKRGDSGLEALLRAVLLDSDNKVPAERLRIVGALASGYIIESGSNANGNYVRFADGTQWCSVLFFMTTGTIRSLTFPAAFVSAPSMSFCPNTNFGDQTGYNTDVYSVQRSHTGFTCKVEYQNQLYTGQVGITYLAIGKWK